MALLSTFQAPSNPFEPPTLAYSLWSSPLHVVLTWTHWMLVLLRGSGRSSTSSSSSSSSSHLQPLRLVCISDSHTNVVPIPPGDLLIHAGDLTNAGTVAEIQAQLDWLAAQPHSEVVVVAGNHDSYFDPRSRRPEDENATLRLGRIHYLQHAALTLDFASKDSKTTSRKLKLYGAPQIPACGGDEMAFQYKREQDAWSHTVPAETELLITHTPPRWHLDLPVGVGCDFLRREVWRVRPRTHIFGHVHAGHGSQTVYWDEAQAAYERLMMSQGWLAMLYPGVWMDVLRVLIHDLMGIVWTRVWGADTDRTVMVNAGLVDWQNQLVNQPQTIII